MYGLKGIHSKLVVALQVIQKGFPWHQTYRSYVKDIWNVVSTLCGLENESVDHILMREAAGKRNGVGVAF
ncbi:hypothetical protein HanIR_Chr17g0892531 [Helianthus annuus]|nr:hypothetical protein HanIR_Chr17g0892531 [Helianthus annuus]